MLRRTRRSSSRTEQPSSPSTAVVVADTTQQGRLPPVDMRPKLQNIVSTMNLNCRLDLKTIALHSRNAEYNAKRFAAVIVRIREPKTTALIFASGRMVVTGAKSEDDSKLASRKFARSIQRLGFDPRFEDFKIQNMVASIDVKRVLRLEGIDAKFHGLSSYEPEMFPGLSFKMAKPKVVLLMFVSGKIVLTGAKRREEIDKAFELIWQVVEEFGRPKEEVRMICD